MERVAFVEVFIRQAHPGPGWPPYASFERKFADAERYVDEEVIPWTVVVDDVEGTVHQRYGGLADPSYLIDADGRVAFYDMWTHVPTLQRALDGLMAKGGRGVVGKGVYRVPRMGAAMTSGWKGIRRGLPQSYIDLETAAPGAGAGTWLGYRLRPLLAPLTLRAEPLPASARLALGAGAALLAGMAAGLAARRLTRSAA